MVYPYPQLIGLLEKKDPHRARLVKQHLWFREAWYTVQATEPAVVVMHDTTSSMPVLL